MVKELDKRAIDWTLVKPGAAGQVRPDVKRDAEQRQADASLRQGAVVKRQSGAGEVPMTGETPASQVRSPHAPLAHSVPTKEAPKPSVADGQVRSEPRHQETPTAASQRATPAPDTAAMNQLVEAAKKAFSDLNKLAQGGQKVAKTILPAAATPQDALRNALINQFTLASKKSAQPGKDAAKSPEKELPAAVAKDEGKVRQPSDRVGAEKIAEAVAQRSGPFAAQPHLEARRVDEQKKKIETDIAAEKGLQMVAGGHGVEGVARAHQNNPEFSKGSHNIAYIDEDDLAAVEGNVGPVSGRAVALDGSSAREVAVRLHYSNKILKTKNDSPPIGVLIAQTTDNVPLSERMSDAGYLEQAAYGTRFTPYGKGIIG
jgi:hypothetical protein